MRFMQLKRTMQVRHAIQSNGTAVVVKLLHPGFNELRILQRLHSIKLPCFLGPTVCKSTETSVCEYCNHVDFEPTFNGILIGFQDGRSNPYSWTMDKGDSLNEVVASSGEIYASMLCLDSWPYNAE